MTKIIKSTVSALLITMPLVFVLMFLGYFPVQFSLVLQTDNVVGEGICQTYVCPVAGYAAFYNIDFYFGSKLKKATLGKFHYDVTSLPLTVSDVSEFDITGMDVYIKNIHVSHIEPEDILPLGEEVKGTKAALMSKKGALHVKVHDPNNGATVTLSPTFIPKWFWGSYFTVMLFVAVLFALVLRVIFERIPALKLPLFNMISIFITLLSGCFFCGSLPYVTYVNFLLNLLFLFAVSLLLNALTLPFLGTLLTMAFTTFWYVANYYVISFRSKPILPADLKAAGTAAEVMGAYNFTPSWKMILGICLVTVYGVLLVIIWKQNKHGKEKSVRKQIIYRGVYVFAALTLMFIGINTNTFKSLSSFAWDAVLMKSFHEEGMILTYLKCVLNSQVKKPEGYSRELVDSFLSEYQKDQKSEETRPTNIIMVMNEAFSDLRTVGLNPNINVMPFVDSLDKNTVEGSLYVSVFGGGTCNTEFEALTGNSLAFLGSGAYPYTENVTERLFSLAWYFKNKGFMTEAFHPNEAQNWNRNMVYPNLGFNNFHSIKDFKDFGDLVYLHDMPADISDYLYMESVEKEHKEQPRFLFDVTMQNHSGYERWLDVEKAKTVEENGKDLYVDTQIYLSLIKASDDELKQLIQTYQDSDEPTMVIFFGDHQPGLPEIAINEVYTEMHSQLDLYKSKFFIWTNYDTPEWHNAGISANYLPWLILDQGNFPLPPYVQMLKELYEHYPIISSQGVMDANGNIYASVNEVMDDPLIQKYQYVQYANLFDEINPAWFE